MENLLFYEWISIPQPWLKYLSDKSVMTVPISSLTIAYDTFRANRKLRLFFIANDFSDKNFADLLLLQFSLQVVALLKVAPEVHW